MTVSTRCLRIPAWFVTPLVALALAVPVGAEPARPATGAAREGDSLGAPKVERAPVTDPRDPRNATVLIRVASSLRRGRGSGFLVGDGGWVLTAYHVVAADFGEGRTAPEETVMVLSPWTGRWYEAQVRACDPGADLALLRLETTGLPALSLDGLEERDPAALAARWKDVELLLTGFPADLGSEARADEVAADLCPTSFLEVGKRGAGTVAFMKPCRVQGGWSGGPVTRSDTGAAIAVFHSVYRPNDQPGTSYPAAALLFQVVGLIRAAGADPKEFAQAKAPTVERPVDAPERVARQIRSVTLAAQGNWEKVEAEQRETLAREPANPEAHFLLGLARAAKGDLEDATGEFRAVAKEWPGSVLVALHLGLALQQKGDNAAAEATLRSVLERRPKEMEAQLALARALADQDKLDEAAAILTAAREAAPHHPAVRYQLGQVLLRQEKNSEALKEFRAAIELVGYRESFVHVHVAYARALEALKRYGEAETELRSVLRRSPENGEAHFCLVNVLMKRGKKPEARLEFARLKKVKNLDPVFAATLTEIEEKLK